MPEQRRSSSGQYLAHLQILSVLGLQEDLGKEEAETVLD